LGLAVGDALGAPLEFLTATEVRAKYGVLRDMTGGGWLSLQPGHVTDDTQMSLCVARSLCERGWSPRDIAERFAVWMKSRPVDVGNTCRRGIRRYIAHGTVHGPPNPGDAGNGAAMRMTPVALASLADREVLARWAVEQGHITHNHPLSDAACVLVGTLVHLACTGHTRSRMREEALAAIRRYPSLQFERYRGQCSAYVVETIQTVLHHFFATESLEECLIATVNVGGDADTAGAIVGTIAGAYYGVGAIPRRWRRRLDQALVRELLDLADRLVGQSPLGRRLRA